MQFINLNLLNILMAYLQKFIHYVINQWIASQQLFRTLLALNFVESVNSIKFRSKGRQISVGLVLRCDNLLSNQNLHRSFEPLHFWTARFPCLSSPPQEVCLPSAVTGAFTLWLALAEWFQAPSVSIVISPLRHAFFNRRLKLCFWWYLWYNSSHHLRQFLD